MSSSSAQDVLREMLNEEAPDDAPEKASEVLEARVVEVTGTVGVEDETVRSANATLTSDPTVVIDFPDPVALFPRAMSDDECAEQLMRRLPKSTQTYLRDQVRYGHNRYPLWFYFCGSILRQYEISRLNAPIIDPTWLSDLRKENPDLGMTTCVLPSCGAKFQEKRLGQRYCSQEHGTQGELLGLNKAKPRVA